MPSRRHVLAASAAAALSWRLRPAAAARPRTPLKGTVGLELYSLRHLLKQDVPGGLRKARALGFEDVEVPQLYGKSAAEFAALLKKTGLRAQSLLAPFERCRDDMAGVIADAQALGVRYVLNAWLPHERRFTKDDCDRAVEVFLKNAPKARDAGLAYGYHIHGYEFEASPEGTLMDRFLAATGDAVPIEMDVFWVVRGGGNPVALLEKYPGRFPLVHLKDIAKGQDICHPNGRAPDETSVPLGAGMIDWPAVLRATETAGVKLYYVEDEHPEAERQIPQTLRYLAGLRL
jgi:sugar phosphate isomerase/epimerase